MATSWKGAPKDPEDVVDYAQDWANEIGDRTITLSQWFVESGDVTIEDDSTSGSVCTVRLSGGTVAASPSTLRNHATFSDGQELDCSNVLVIKERVLK